MGEGVGVRGLRARGGGDRVSRVIYKRKDISICGHWKSAWPRGYKTFSMLNSTEHESFSAHKC